MPPGSHLRGWLDVEKKTAPRVLSFQCGSSIWKSIINHCCKGEFEFPIIFHKKRHRVVVVTFVVSWRKSTANGTPEEEEEEKSLLFVFGKQVTWREFGNVIVSRRKRHCVSRQRPPILFCCSACYMLPHRASQTMGKWRRKRATIQILTGAAAAACERDRLPEERKEGEEEEEEALHRSMTWRGKKKRVGTWIPPEGRFFFLSNTYCCRPFCYLDFEKGQVAPSTPQSQSTLWSGSGRSVG